MSYHYSDPSREHDTYALPDVEVFYCQRGEWWYDHNGERCNAPDEDCPEWDANNTDVGTSCHVHTPNEAGWYYWFCFPGCLPDSEPFGPYDTEDEALQACREDFCEDFCD